MSDRPTADIIRGLRTAYAYSTPERQRYDEAADRLTDEDRKRRFFETCNQIAQDKLAAIDALRPPCPTCGGTPDMMRVHCRGCGATWLNNGDCGCTCVEGDENYEQWTTCCVDGKVSIGRMVAAWQAIETEWAALNELDSWSAEEQEMVGLLSHLRAMKP